MNEDNALVLLASALLSLLFFYVPGFKTWYDKQQSSAKQLVMVGAIFIIVATQYGLMLYRGEAVLGADSVLAALTTFFVALATNAGVYRGIRYIGKSKESGE